MNTVRQRLNCRYKTYEQAVNYLCFSQTQGVCYVHQIDNGGYSSRPMTPGYLNYTQPDDQPSAVKLNATLFSFSSTPVSIKLCNRWDNPYR